MAYLIDTALSNIQKGKIKFKDSDLTLMEKLVDEFQEELFASGLKIIELNKNRVILDDLRTTVGIDMELNFHSGIKFYGEFMADDFILTPKTILIRTAPASLPASILPTPSAPVIPTFDSNIPISIIMFISPPNSGRIISIRVNILEVLWGLMPTSSI